MKRLRTKKRGISPVIATVLLIAIVIVIGLIIFLWFRSMTREAITKFGGENIELVCDDVEFEASYSEGFLYISNTGNVPIFRMEVKISNEGNYETKNLEEISADWPTLGMDSGGTFSAEIGSYLTGANEITIIPVLRGNSKSGEANHVCSERNGVKISLG